MNTNNYHEENEQRATTRAIQNELEPGRYSERGEEENSADLAANIAKVDEEVEVMLLENAEQVSQELGQLYADINQHVNGQLSQVEQANKSISELIGNLNTQLRNSLNK